MRLSLFIMLPSILGDACEARDRPRSARPIGSVNHHPNGCDQSKRNAHGCELPVESEDETRSLWLERRLAHLGIEQCFNLAPHLSGRGDLRNLEANCTPSFISSYSFGTARTSTSALPRGATPAREVRCGNKRIAVWLHAC